MLEELRSRSEHWESVRGGRALSVLCHRNGSCSALSDLFRADMQPFQAVANITINCYSRHQGLPSAAGHWLAQGYILSQGATCSQWLAYLEKQRYWLLCLSLNQEGPSSLRVSAMTSWNLTCNCTVIQLLTLPSTNWLTSLEVYVPRPFSNENSQHATPYLTIWF